jgi:uncharacterized protein (DUF305 family)
MLRRMMMALMLAETVLLTACGTTGGAGTAGQTAPTTAGNTATAEQVAPTATGAMGGMDHGSMGGTASDAPYDAQFIDSMIMHHKGAVAMAEQALKEAERPEIKTLAENIVKTQQDEIGQMEQWRKQWYPDLAPTQGMGMDMGRMEVSSDTSKPFDQRFIEAMIPHHQGAIAMAKDAQQKAEHAEIKTLAAAIIIAQEAEITQMQAWQQQWFAQ